MTTATVATPRLIECVVIGNKVYHGRNKDESRYIAKPGDTVFVTATQLTAFPHRLTTPALAAARKKTAELLVIANAEIAALKAAATRPARPEGAVDTNEGEGVSGNVGEGTTINPNAGEGVSGGEGEGDSDEEDVEDTSGADDPDPDPEEDKRELFP